ncbi:mediator of RNA polymerase II transcription subunit 24-like isoform X1 [Mytilus galloprovincialis]|uniref:mediator of RNA polymerase II transcription subunit 24-like isoform X1 n=1 Tax=Mytilus galloprovincialis TaxID=29158 RepID=UPI003F7BD3B3
MEQASSNQSKGSIFCNKVKTLLMRAWRERWQDNHWGVMLKKMLLDVPGESKELAEILMQQALVGPNPNNLILSYLKHSVTSQVIPYNTALGLITKYDEFSKPYCILGLINMVENIATNFSFVASMDNGLTTCRCLQSTIHWLLIGILQSQQRVKETRQPQQEYISIIDRASTAIQKIIELPTVQALLYVAMSDDMDKFREFEQAEVNVRGTLSQIHNDALPAQARQKVTAMLNSLSKIQEFAPPSQAVLEVTTLPICPSISVLVAIEAILNPTNDIQPFVEQISVTEKLMKLTRPYLYSELIRACFMGLIDANEKDNELNWAAFTYLKLPQVVVKMNQQAPRNDFSTDIEQGIDLLLNSVPLLDLTDIKLNCDCVQFLLLEFTKHDLITESQSQRLLHRRSTESEKPAKASDVATKPTPSLIIKAEPTVGSILKTLHTNVSALNSSSANTLDADCSKNQEALISVLCHMLSGKSFDLIIAAAAANGTLQNFAVKLVKINEYAKQVQQTQGESSKAAQNRALLFDISFLMLCHITQLYGSEIVTTAPDFFDTFFYQWATQCLPEDSKYKCIDNHTPTEQNKVDQLLGNLLKSHELNYIMTRWQEMCTNMPFVAQEILFAWEHGALSPDYVKAMVNRSKSKMLCLPIIMSTWLCSYMNTVGEESREKPLKMLQFLQNINPTEGEVHFTERSHLMSNILRKIVNDILPVNMKDKTNQHIPLKLLPCEVLDKCLKNLFSKGWIDMQSVYTLEQLLNLCGGDWFGDRTVMCMLEGSRLEDLNKALSIVYAIFYMDLEPLTLSLILHTIPKFLQTSQHTNLLTDPRGYILAKLCVMCITSAQTAKTAEKDIMSHLRRGRKRSRKEIELDEMEEPECRPVKRSKTMEPQLTLDAEGFNFGESSTQDFLTAKEDGETSPTFDAKDHLNKALVNMFRLMNAISQERSVGPQISFIVSFIEEAIKCGPQYSRGILQFMPPQMLSQIMRNMPAVFTNQQILHICDLSTLTGRKWAAKAVCQNARYKHDYINVDRNS